MKQASKLKSKIGATPTFAVALQCGIPPVGAESKAKSMKSADVLFHIAHEVENMSKEKAFTLVDALDNVEGEATFKLGGALAVILDNASREGGEDWLEGYPSFKELCGQRFNIGYRKAMYLINIYKHLVEQKIPWAAVKDLGWSKLRVLASKKVITKSNVDKWVKEAETLTVEKLEDSLKGDVANKTKALTIKVKHEDQIQAIRAALDKAKHEAKTEYDAVALHNIAQAYLCNAMTTEMTDEIKDKPKGKAKLKEYWVERLSMDFDEMLGDLQGHDAPTAVLNVFEKKWPDVTVTVELPE